MTPSDEEIRTAIAEQAGEWFIQHEAGALSSGDSLAFLAWLRASPMHVEAYLGVASIASRLRAAVAGSDVPLESFLASVRAVDDTVVSIERPARQLPPGLSRGAVSRTWQIAAALAVLAVLAVGVLWWAHDGQLLGIPRTYRTVHGEQSVRRLPDGSTVHLDTDSAVTVRYSSSERLVEITRGQAFFEVVPNHSGRWFRVLAGDAGVIAVGTRFNVDRQGRALVVTVADGEVAAFTGTPVQLLNERGVPAGRHVTAGYQLRIDAGVMSAQPVAVDLRQVLGWLEHRIIFEHRPLGEVASEFNRYARFPVEIDDARLRALPVSGTFDADDMDSFVAFLETQPGVRVEKTPARIRVMGVSPGT
jgi:transmembrane sensor